MSEENAEVGDPFIAIADEGAREKARAVKAKYGRVRVVEIGGNEMVFRPPSRGEFDSYMDSDKSSTFARQLCLDTCEYPDGTELKAIFDDFPHVMHGACGKAIIELAGQGKAKTKAL